MKQRSDHQDARQISLTPSPPLLKSFVAPCSAATSAIAPVAPSVLAWKGHLVWVLSVSYPGGRNKQISLSAEQKPLVQQWLRNYQKVKATLERICESQPQAAPAREPPLIQSHP